MMKTMQLDKNMFVFNLPEEQDQIKYALGMSSNIDPRLMEDRHWALLDEWRDTLIDRFEYKRREELEKLLVL